MSAITSPFLTFTPLAVVSRTAWVTSIVCTWLAASAIASWLALASRLGLKATTAAMPWGTVRVPSR